MVNLKDKVILVTGASSGIGKACVEDFIAHGAKVVLASRNVESLQSLANSINPDGMVTHVVKTDVSLEEDCKNAVEETVSRFGKIDILVCNAGLSMRALFDEVDLNVLHRLMDVNFWGTVYCTKYALPYLKATQGTVVGITSICSYIGLPGRTGYSASKFAMLGFLETLRSENIDSGLHVLTVAPGYTATNVRNSALTADGSPQGSSPRDEKSMMSAADVATAIRKGIEGRKSNMVLTFTTGKLAVFLNKWCPTLVSRLAARMMNKEVIINN